MRFSLQMLLLVCLSITSVFAKKDNNQLPFQLVRKIIISSENQFPAYYIGVKAGKNVLVSMQIDGKDIMDTSSNFSKRKKSGKSTIYSVKATGRIEGKEVILIHQGKEFKLKLKPVSSSLVPSISKENLKEKSFSWTLPSEWSKRSDILVHAWVGNYYSGSQYYWDYSSSSTFNQLSPNKKVSKEAIFNPLPSSAKKNDLFLGVQVDHNYKNQGVEVLDRYYSYERF
jgi:hypothetical protein